MSVAIRRRVALAVAAALVLAAVTAVAATGGRAGGEGRTGTPLAWSGPTRVVTVPELPSDRVLTGRLRNTSLRPLRLDIADVRLLDAERRPVRSTARFAAAFGHALYSPRDAPREVAARERERLGEAVTVAPGASVPVTLSWRLAPGGGRPVVVRLGALALRLPEAP